MKELIIVVENLKCGGCENTIQKALLNLNGIQTITINSEKAEIVIQYIGSEVATEKIIEKKLAQLGYPKKGTGSSFQKAKSYVSCAIGKISDKASS